jgi:TnpA family transposase
VRTVYLLHYVPDPTLRQQVRTQLNRGEARQDLARWLFFADQGMFRFWDYYQMEIHQHLEGFRPQREAFAGGV